MSSELVTSFRTGPYLAARVTGRDAATASDRSLHIGFLLDVSYSMCGERLSAVKRTLAAVSPLFKPTDFGTVVTFSAVARTIINHLPLDAAGVAQFLAATAAMVPESNTDLGAGITHMSALHSDYDAVILLTDGEITAGITRDEGIQAVLAGFRGRPIHTLGYGADHNRRLLNHVAVHSCATYTYVDSETTLPISMADLLEGLRSEVLHDAVLTVTGATCLELNAEGPVRRIGGVVPGRPYWSVFQLPPGPATLTLSSVEETVIMEAAVDDVTGEALEEVKEQIMRARVVTLLARVTAVLESRAHDAGDIDGSLDAQLQSLMDEIGESTRPLMLRMKGQLIDIRCYLRDLPAPPSRSGSAIARVDSSAVARFTSVTGVLSSQRGVTSYRGGEDPDQTFSSPNQRSASQQVSATYSGAEHQEDPD